MGPRKMEKAGNGSKEQPCRWENLPFFGNSPPYLKREIEKIRKNSSPEFFAVHEALKMDSFSSQLQNDRLFSNSFKTSVIIKLVGAGVICIQIDGFVLFPPFQFTKQQASNSFYLDFRICRQKENLSVG